MPLSSQIGSDQSTQGGMAVLGAGPNVDRQRSKSGDVEVLMVKGRHLGIFQGQRIPSTRLNDDVMSSLCGVRQNVREIVEDVLGELDDVVVWTVRLEIPNDVISKVVAEDKRILARASDVDLSAIRGVLGGSALR